MNTNKKVLIIVFSMLSMLSLATVINVWFTFIDFGNKATITKANSIAESVRDGLTTHMTLGAMDKRDVFLNNMKKHQNVKTLRVIRAQTIIDNYGNGAIDSYEYDDIEKKVLVTGETITKEYIDRKNKYLRISIPYVATKYTNPNCLTCHTNVQEGDVLGAISLELDITEIEDITFEMILNIGIISFIFLIISFIISGYFIKPYIQLFDDLENGISKAYKGDFSFQITTSLSNEAGKVAKRLNDLSEIFKFKKTIEHDDKKEMIYERISHILEHNFNIKEFLIIENNRSSNKRKVAYKSALMSEFNTKVFEDVNQQCRAFRTNSEVCSLDFHKICNLCFREEKESICLPFHVSDELSLTLLVYVHTKNELLRIKELVPIITNYFELSEPVLQTKLLMEKLRNKSLKDPMTGLYNRRFLDNYLENEIRTQKQFTIMMLDVDFFKQVNDTYGHDVGDTVIKGLSDVILNNIKGSNIAVRYGGEEFVILLVDTPLDKAKKIGETIRKQFAKIVFGSKTDSFSKTLSVGIAIHQEDSDSAWRTIKYADVALYNAKENGRDQLVVFEQHMYQEDYI